MIKKYNLIKVIRLKYFVKGVALDIFISSFFAWNFEAYQENGLLSYDLVAIINLVFI